MATPENTSACEAAYATPRSEIFHEFKFNPTLSKSGLNALGSCILVAIAQSRKKEAANGGTISAEQSRIIDEKAYNDTLIILSALESTKIGTGDQNSTISSYLNKYSSHNKISKIAITVQKDIIFYDLANREIMKLSSTGVLGRGAIQTTAIEKRVSCMEGMPEKRQFPPLTPPAFKLTALRPARVPLSIRKGITQDEEGPELIAASHNDEAACSTYAQILLENFFGKQELRSLLRKHDKIPSTWELKEYYQGNYKSVVNTLKNFKIVTNSKEQELKMSNSRGYYNDIAAIYQAVDSGEVPGLVTLYYPRGRYLPAAFEYNRTQPNPDLHTYGTHIAVISGREPVQSLTVSSGISLEKFMESQIEIKPEFAGMLKMKVIKKDGSEILIDSSSNLKRLNLKSGDQVAWQDLLMSHHYKGGKTTGLAKFLTKESNFKVQEYITFPSLKEKTNPNYKPTGYFHVRPDENLADRVWQEMFCEPAEVQYYLLALKDLGIDEQLIKPHDPLPKFDFPALKRYIDSKGGPAKFERDLKTTCLSNQERQHNRDPQKPRARYIMVDKGKNAWDHLSGVFQKALTGGLALSGEEKTALFKAVEQSCPGLTINKNGTITSGEFIYLTEKRIQEIADYIKSLQTKSVDTKIYSTGILESGNTPESFLKNVFDREMPMALLLAGDKLPEELRPKWENLDDIEESYIWKMFTDANPQLRRTANGKVAFDKLNAGLRMKLPKQELSQRARLIVEKRLLQMRNGHFMGPMKDEETLMGAIPKQIRCHIEQCFPGTSMEDTVVRNTLYFIYYNEQMSGRGPGGYSWEAFKEGAVQTVLPESVEEKAIKSVGAMETKAYDDDLNDRELIRLFRQHGLSMPTTRQSYYSMLKNNEKASVLVAGHRLKTSMTAFRSLMKANGEDCLDCVEDRFAVMLAASHQRGPHSVTRAVFENWAFELCKAAGVRAEFSVDDIDASEGKISNEKQWDMIRKSLLKAARALGEKNLGKIWDESEALRLINGLPASRLEFITSPLFKALKKYYKRNYISRDLKFTFSYGELDRGNHIFNYGMKIIHAHRKEDNWRPASQKANFQWRGTFLNRYRYVQILAQMQSVKAPEYIDKGDNLQSGETEVCKPPGRF